MNWYEWSNFGKKLNLFDIFAMHSILNGIKMFKKSYSLGINVVIWFYVSQDTTQNFGNVFQTFEKRPKIVSLGGIRTLYFHIWIPVLPFDYLNILICFRILWNVVTKK